MDLAALTTAPQAEPTTGVPARFKISQEVVLAEPATDASPADIVGDASPVAPPPIDQNARGARYYQPRPSPAARVVSPEDLELMRRLQEMRDASDLILQFEV
jgi:hypothetical protein